VITSPLWGVFMSDMSKRRCFIFVSLLILSFISLPSVIGQESKLIIQHPSGLSSFITVSKSFNITIETHLFFINPYENESTVKYNIPIVDVTGGVDIYGTNNSELAYTKNQTYYIVNYSLAPYSTLEIGMKKYYSQSENNPSNGIYTLEYQSFVQQGLSFNKIEIRIPLRKGLDTVVEPLKYISITPTNQYKSADHLVLSWDGEEFNAVYMEYNYSFNLVDFLNSNPIIAYIISALIGAIITYIFSLIIKNKKEKQKHEKNIKKYKRKKIASRGLLYIGIILIISGVTALSITNYYTSNSDKNLTYSSSVSLMISICSLGLGLLSLGLSFSSSIKNDINSNENFLRIVDHFEDKRIEIFQSISDGNFKPLIRNIWKMVTYTKRAVKLYEMANITKDNLDIFCNQLNQLLFWSAIPFEGVQIQPQQQPSSNTQPQSSTDTSPQPSNNAPPTTAFVLRTEDIEHVLSICELFKNFRLDDEQKKQLESHINYIKNIRKKMP